MKFVLQPFAVLVFFFVSISLPGWSFTFDKEFPVPKERNYTTLEELSPKSIKRYRESLQKPVAVDPIRFKMHANKAEVKIGEEIEVTISAQLTDVPPGAFFIFEAQKSFSLKMVLPENFVQTGGTYYDYVGETLSSDKRLATYTLKGYFTREVEHPSFLLLRGPKDAHSQSVFEKKIELSVKLAASSAVAVDNARQAAPSSVTTICGASNLDITSVNCLIAGSFSTNGGTNVIVKLYSARGDNDVCYNSIAAMDNESDDWLVLAEAISFNTSSGNFTFTNVDKYHKYIVALQYTDCNNSNIEIINPSGCGYHIINTYIPEPSVTTPIYKCGADGSVVLSAGGGQAGEMIWFAGNSTLQTGGLDYTFNFANATNQKKIYVYRKLNACESPWNTIDVNITATPSAPQIITSTGLITCGGSATLSVNSSTSCNGTILWSNGATGNSITVSPTTETKYKAKCRSGSCESGDSNEITITVNQPASPTISPSSGSICSGASVTLTASGCGDAAKWNNGQTAGSITVYPSSSTTYTVDCPYASGCNAPTQASVTITVTGVSVPSLAANTSIVGSGQEAILTAGCAGTIKWEDNSTSSPRKVYPTVETKYSVTCIVGSCTSAAAEITIGICNANPNWVEVAGSSYCDGSTRRYNVKDNDPCSPSYNTIESRSIPCGCSPTAIPTLSTSQPTICEGQSASLSASGCGTGESYVWSNGVIGNPISVSPTESTSYTVHCQKNGCNGPESTISLSVTVNGRPAAPSVTPLLQNVALGQSATFTAAGCNLGTISWNVTAPNTPSLTVTPASVGTYVYKATCTQNNCISDPSNDGTLNVLPNCTNKNVSASPSTAICPGTAVTLTFSGCTGQINWSTGETTAAINVLPNVTTEYTVYCDLVCSKTYTVNVKTNETTVTATNNGVCNGTSAQLTATSTNGGTFSWSGPNSFTSTVYNPTVTRPGSYEVTVTYNGCPYKASTTVNFSPPAAPQLSASLQAICYGQSSVLTATGCDGTHTVTWANAVTGTVLGTGATLTVSPAVSTSYKARCDRSSTCVSLFSPSIAIDVRDFVINASDQTICSGESITLTASCCVGTIVWSNSMTGASISVTPGATTSYYANCIRNGDGGQVRSNTQVVGVIGPISYDGEPLTECTNDLKTNITVRLKGTLSALTVQYKLEKWVSGAFTILNDWTANESVLTAIPDGRYRLTVRGVDNADNIQGECTLAAKELFLKCDCGFSATAVPNPVVVGDAIILAVDGLPFNAGKALSFADNNHTFEPSFNLGSISNTFTWEAWVMPNATLTNNNYDEHYLLFPVQGGNGSLGNDVGIGIAVGTNGVRLVEHGSDYLPQILRYDTPLSSSAWNHIAVVYNNKVPTIYINGIEKASNPSNATSAKNIHPTAHIGGAHWGYDLGRYIGKVDEVRVWSTARTGAQILTNLDKILSGQEPSLVAYWRFEEITSNQVKPSPAQGRYANLGGTYQLVDGNNNDPGSLNVTFSWTNPDGFSASGPVVVAYPDHDLTYTVSRSDATCKANIPVKVLPEPCELSISATNTNLLPGENSVLTVGNGSFTGGKGLLFDGGGGTSLNQNFNFGDLHTNFTWEAWILPEQTVTGNVYSNRYALYPDWGGGTYNGSNAGMGIAVGTNGVQLAEHTDDYMPLVLNHSAALSGWTHIAVVYQNNKPALYINGQPSSANASAPTSPKLVHPSATLGGDYYGHFAGKIDEVRVWSKARTQTEIESDYRKILTGFEANLRAYFRFETISGNQTSAMVPSGGTATLNGGVSLVDGFTAPKPATPANQYVWSTDDGTTVGSGTQITVTPAQNTTYSVVCTNCTGCNTPTKEIQVVGSLNACYLIKPKNSNKPIYADYATGNANGVPVKQLTLNGMDAQIWQFTPAATAGYVKIINAEDNRLIESSGGNIRMWVERTGYNQAWKIIRNTDNSYRISPQNDLTVSFDVSGNSQTDGAQIQLSGNHTADNQKYLIELTTCPYNPPADQQCAATGYITYERWNDISGTSVNDLKNSTKFTQVADVNELRSSFEAPEDIADNYGARMRGYICPPANGQYTFYVAADDNTELWLSTDDNPANKVKIAYHNDWSSSRQYLKYNEQKSQPITLKKGTKYYIEALVKEGGGGDNLSVSWQIPGRNWDQLPIAGQYLSPFSTCSFNVVLNPDKTEFLLGTVVKLKAVRAGSLTTSDIFNWEHKTLKHFVSGLTAVDSTRTRTADSVYVKPLYNGTYTYTVTVQGKPTCFKDIKLTAKDILCGCDDCTTNDRVKNTDNPAITPSNGSLTTTKNYVVENVHLDAGSSSVVQQVTYLDGLGRPLQSIKVATGGYDFHTPTTNDIVHLMEYDNYGRETNKYLPYANATNSGAYRTGSTSERSAYYSDLQRSGNDFEEIVYDHSPLNRVIEQRAPGDGAKTIIKYRHNDGTDAIKMLTYDWSSAENDVTINVAIYTANMLFVTETKRENALKPEVTKEYKDLNGRVVCRDVSGRKTYYCYDDLGQLRCVVPPEANTILANPSFNPFGDNRMFAYHYNDIGLLVRKKVPDAGLVTMEYDSQDRLIKTTDANGNVVLNEYDELNRLVRTKKSDGTLLTENYFDTDGYTGAKTFDATHAFGQAKTTGLQGMSTGSKVNILGTSNYLISTVFYDNLGRVIQTVADNHLGTLDRSSSKLDFSGRVMETRHSSHKGVEILTRNSYDRGNRLKASCQQVYDESTPAIGKYWEPVARNIYTGTGELKEKILGCYLQRVGYTYNMRGWVTGINKPTQLYNNFADKDFFGMSFDYDAVGNIITQTFGTAQRKGAYSADFAELDVRTPYTIGYSYDNLSRLKTANMTGNNTFALGGNDNGIKYDDNGNIKNMTRTWNGTVVDNLEYTYVDNSNQLQSIREDGSANEFFGSSSEYMFDPNGNLTNDSGKGITGIEYNHLNLAQKIKKGKEGIINYTYTATGQKLTASFSNGKLYNYLSGIVYEGSAEAIEFIPTIEGRVLPPNRAVNPKDGIKNNFYRYEYQLKDHLGNLRVACRCAERQGATRPEEAYAPIVVQENHPDPWGLTLPINTPEDKVAGYPADRFTFTDKEKQAETGWFDFGARMYDPQRGGWNNIDPKAEATRRFSPYVYTYSNPLNYIDPDGMTGRKIKDFDGNEHEIGDGDLTNIYTASDEGDESKGKNKASQTQDKPTPQINLPRSTIVNPKPLGSDPIIQGALSVSTALALDDATGVGVLDDPLIPIILAGTAIYTAVKADILQKMSDEIDRILKKTAGPLGAVYELRVRKTGTYMDVRGNPINLNAGDVWKYGETTIGNQRYNSDKLEKMVPGGVTRRDIFYGNQVQIKVMEKYLIYGYFFNNGTLPPGNRYFR